MNTLSYNLGLRILCEPEYCHPAFNNFKSAVKYSGLTPCLLKSTLLSHVAHGPYLSGRNLECKLEASSVFGEMTFRTGMNSENSWSTIVAPLTYQNRQKLSWPNQQWPGVGYL